MLGVAAFKFLLHLGVGVVPEVLQVARDLDRALGRGEQVEHQRDLAIGDGGSAGEAEQFLEFDRQHRRGAVGEVFEALARAARHGDVGRGETF